MTNDEIDKLEAGPELDALVAEKVMQRRWMIRNGACYADATFMNAPDCWLEFKPSTDIAAAWEVVEKLKDLNQDVASFDFDLIYSLREGSGEPSGPRARRVPEDQRWFAQFGDAETGSATAATAPFSICRAALKAANK